MSGFSFGVATPQQQRPAPLFGTPLASSTPAAGTGTAGSSSLFGTNPTSTTGTAFSFSTPATSQPQPQTGFSLGQPQAQTTGFSLGQPQTQSTGFSLGQPQTQTTGFSLGQPQAQTGFSLGGLGASTATTSAPAGLGFSFGGTPNVAATTATAAQPTTTSTAPSGGLGGIPSASNVGPRISTLALGNDPGTGWSTRNDNRAVQEIPVPPEIMAAVEELKNQMKNHKTLMMEVNRSFDLDVDSVSEQIEEVRLGLTTLVNVMHKQELQCAALIKDMQELSKDMDLLSQARDVPAFGYGGTSQLLHNFLYELLDKYSARMLKYKVEIERAEFSLQTIVGSNQVNAKDLWASLTAIKDTVILLAAQIQQLHEEVRNELNVHKNISQVLFVTTPKPWLNRAISGNLQSDESTPPLERILSTPSKSATAATNLETMYQRTYSMLNRMPSHADPRSLLAPISEAALRTPSYDPRSSNSFAQSASYYHPSVMGSYLGPSSPASGASLKRSKK